MQNIFYSFFLRSLFPGNFANNFLPHTASDIFKVSKLSLAYNKKKGRNPQPCSVDSDPVHFST